MLTPLLAVTSCQIWQTPAALRLAQQLNLPFISATERQAQGSLYRYLLCIDNDRLAIYATQQPKLAPLLIDFTHKHFKYRLAKVSRHTELIARAIGIKPKSSPVIVDATAGLGQDSFILAALGYQVILIERAKVLSALLQNALQRAQLDPNLTPIVQRLSLQTADAVELLPTLANAQRLDVIYLDPMFPPRKKTAAVKKEMLLVKDLIGEDPDSPTLFNQALACAAQRVVVKRPRLAPPLAERSVSFAITGRSSRFDVYLV